MFITLGRQNERLGKPEGAIERLFFPAFVSKRKEKSLTSLDRQGISYRNLPQAFEWGSDI